MKVFFLFCICWSLTNASFINPYPKFEAHPLKNDDDFGTPLYLTPYIKSGRIKEGQNASIVSHPQMQWLISHSGYFTVDDKYNSNIFFWFFPAKVNSENAPVLLWLQGGPGASSLFGLFAENGPFEVTKTLKLSPRKYSWHLNHNLIYIDNPVGTGFSFTDNDEGYARDEKQIGENLYAALRQFFQLFPRLQQNDFFISGESYAGKYVPAIGHQIHQMNQQVEGDFKINLKGVAIGNGFSDPLHQLKYGDYLYQIGLIDSNARNSFAEYEKQAEDFIRKGQFDEAFEIMDNMIDGDESSPSLFQNLTGFSMYYNYLKTSGEDSSAFVAKFIQSSIFRKAIHVGNNTFHDIDDINIVEIYLKNDIMNSVAAWVSELLSYYRVCIYNGQLDIIVAYPLTVNYLQQLDFKDREIYLNSPRFIWKVDNEIAGYAKEAGNLVEVLVRNAGHMVPADQPKWALDMILRLTSNKSFAD